MRSGVMTFSGVASNFAGMPLAFAFLATLGRVGLVTNAARQILRLQSLSTGFNLYSFWGLVLTYLYFQIPLMVLIIAPALDGLKREWREAAAILGATQGNTGGWWRSRCCGRASWARMLLLFANAFGAIATAFALTGSPLNIVPILLSRRFAATCCTTRISAMPSPSA